jgi:beta-galactosidase
VYGEFVWTGFDYLGEPDPCSEAGGRSSYFGIFDLAGIPKDRYWLYKSHWRPDVPSAHILPHWTWPGREGEITPVHVYSSGDEAELFVNGESAGRRRKSAEKIAPVAKDDSRYYDVCSRYRIVWEVPYEPGEIKVIAFRNGRPIGEDSRTTAFKAAAVRLTPEKNSVADGELAFVKVELVDDYGTVLPTANDKVSFRLEGPGEIVAVGNGSSHGLEPFTDVSSHSLYNGCALVIIRRNGALPQPLKLSASCGNLRQAKIEIVAER